eukprot:SAG11_NODE_19809_length_458_cov_1.534819_1_plen_42_part_10
MPDQTEGDDSQRAEVHLQVPSMNSISIAGDKFSDSSGSADST